MSNEVWLLGGLFILVLIALVVVLYPLRKSTRSLFLLTPFLLCVVAFAYWRWGAWPELNNFIQQQLKQQQVQAMLKSISGPQELIVKIQQRLKSHPDSVRGWYLLGRLYASQNQWQQARDAYAKAYHLDPKNEQVAVNYAQSLWQLNHQAFNVEIRELFQSVLQKNANQADALAMLAMDAYMGHSYQQAIDYWQRLLQNAPPQSEDAQAIRKAIAKAQKNKKLNGVKS